MSKFPNRKVNFKYRIIEIDSNNHSMVVRYFTDIVTENSLATSVNHDGSIVMTDEGYPVRCQSDYNIVFYDTINPSQNDISKIINETFPVSWFALKESTITGNVFTDLSNVYPMLGQIGSMSKESNPEVEISQHQIATALNGFYPDNDIVIEIRPAGSSQANVVNVTTKIFK